MSMNEERDELELVIPEAIPGELFKAVAADLYDRYPISKRKADVAAIKVLEIVYSYYEKVEAAGG